MNGIGWITVAEAARLCGTDELRITLWTHSSITVNSVPLPTSLST